MKRKFPPRDEAKDLTLGQQATIAHVGRNLFYSLHAALESIMDIEINEVMPYSVGDSLLFDIGTIIRHSSRFDEMLELANEYESYFESSSISCLKAIIKLAAEARVPAELSQEIEDSPAYAPVNPFLQGSTMINLSIAIVEDLRDYQAKLKELRDLLAAIKRKLDILGY